MRVEAGSYSGAADGEFAQVRQNVLDSPDAVSDLAGVAAELLSQHHRGCVLQMGPACLHYVGELLGLAVQSIAQLEQSGQQILDDRRASRDVGGRRDHVVARLPHVHVVVRVNHLRADLAAQKLRGPVGDHLVGVHVGGGAGAGLEDVHHELIV